MSWSDNIVATRPDHSHKYRNLSRQCGLMTFVNKKTTSNVFQKFYSKLKSPGNELSCFFNLNLKSFILKLDFYFYLNTDNRFLTGAFSLLLMLVNKREGILKGIVVN